MYNRRVSKTNPAVEACGAVDELNAALGWARAYSQTEENRTLLFHIQNSLIGLMGELATTPEDRSRFLQDGYPRVTPELTQKLEQQIGQLEARKITFKGWALPGKNPAGASLDLARTACRRAERRVCALHEVEPIDNHEILVFLNRLSDLLWLLARDAENNSESGPTQ